MTYFSLVYTFILIRFFFEEEKEAKNQISNSKCYSRSKHLLIEVFFMPEKNFLIADCYLTNDNIWYRARNVFVNL